jgi:hypothetical protein
MEEKHNVEKLIDDVKEYAETRMDIIVLNLQDKISAIISSIASVLLLTVLSLFVVFFLSIGVAWWIGQATESPSIGFFCIAGFYLLLAAIIAFNREKLIKAPIINALLKKINIHEED